MLCLVVISSGAACRRLGNDVVKVSVAFTKSDTDRHLSDVEVIVGGDKFWWSDLAAGQVKSITFTPGPNDDRQVTLFYTFNEMKRVWEGPKIGSGTGYRIEIKVDSQGNVTYRHCLLPCSLDIE